MALSSNILEQFGKATAKVESQVAQAVASKCPAGQHWDEFYQMCVKDAVGPELQASTFTSGAQAAVAPEIAPATAPAAPAPTLSSGAQAQVVPEALRMQPEPDRGFFGDVLNTAGNVASAVGNVPLGVIPGASGLSAALDIGGKDPTIGGAAQFALDESGNPVSRFIADEIRPRAADVGEFLGDEFAKSAPGVGLNAGLSAIGAAGGPKLDSGDIGRAVGEYGTPVSPLDLTLSLFVPATADWFDAYRILKGSSLFDDAGRFLPGVTRSQVDNVLRQFGKTVDDLPDLPIGAADALVKGTPVDQGTDAARLLSGPGAGREIPAPRPGIGGAGDEALYHGGADIPDNTLRRYQRGGQDAGGIFLTPNRAYAERYRPTSGGALYQAQIPEGARIFDASKPEDIAAFKAAIGDDYVWSQIAKGGDELSDWANLAQWADELEEAGFDGARFIERTGDPALGRVESVGLFGRELPATRVADEVPAGRATPPAGTAAEVPATTSAAPASPPPPRTPRGTTPTGPMSEGDAVMALRNALREGTGAERARLVAEGRAAQAARLRGAIDATTEQGRALADQVRGAGAGRMLPDEGLGFTLPKEADDALIDKAMRMMQDGKMSPQEAVYGVVNALDEGRRLGPTPYQAKVLSKLTSIDESAFAPYVRARAGLDADWRKMVDDEIAKVVDPQPNVQSQLRSAKRAELEAERFDIQGKSEQAASARLRAATHNAKADTLRAENIRKASEAQIQAELKALRGLNRQRETAARRARKVIGNLEVAGERAELADTARVAREQDLIEARFLREQERGLGDEYRQANRISRYWDIQDTRFARQQENIMARQAREESERLARLQREVDTAQQAWNRAMTRSPQDAMRREGEIAERMVQQFDQIDKTPQAIMDEAFKKITDGAFEGTLGTDEAIRAFEALRYHLQGNRAVLDSLKNAEGMGQYVAGLRATVTGELADSYLTSLMHRTMWLGQGLREAGLESDTANKVVNAIRNAELRARFPEGIPPSILRELDTMKAAPYEESLKGLELFIQRWKNTAFSTDAGVIGVQLVAALRRGGVNMVAGLVNRRLAIMNLPNANLYRTDIELPKRLRNMLDGVMVGARSSPVEPEAGTLLSYMGPWARSLDEGVVAKALDRANSVQFDTMMGWAGDAAYEGNLAMLHMLGRNIENPAVRQQAAEAANAIKSFTNTALRSRRSGMERVLLTSASMTRSGIANMLQMSKLINPTATAEQRILAATLIASQAFYMMTVGKFINDQVGITDFVMDPGLPGFGTIVLPYQDNNGKNVVVNVVPQASVERAIAQAYRALESGDIDAALGAVGRYFGNRGSVLGRFLAGDDRFSLSDSIGADSLPGVVQNLIDLAPVPPLIESLISEGVDPLRSALEFVGISSYGENAFSPLNRARQQAIEALIADGTLPEDLYPQGINYYDLGPGSRDLVNARVRAESPNLITDYEAERRDRDNIYQQTADRAALNEAGRGATLDPKTGEVTGGDYTRSLELSMNGIATAATEITEARAIMDNARKNYDASQAAKRAAYQTEEYQKAIDGLPKTDINVQLADWYEVYYQAQDPNTGLIDYDIVDKAHEELLAQWQELDPQSVNKFLFELDNQEREYPEVIQMDKDLKNIQRDTGYYDLESDAEIEQWWADHPQEAAMSWLLGGRKLPTIEAMNEALNFQSIGLGEGRTDVTLKGFSFPVSTPDDLVTFANLYDVVERDYLSLESGKRGSYLDKNPDMNALLVFLGYDVKLREGAEAELARLEARYGTTSPEPEVVTPDVAPVMSFLEAGKATHPDEIDAQEEYDAMMAAAQTGEGIDEAIAIAQSHLDAHQRALLPENLNNLQFNPYVGEPEKNQEAIDGFTRVIAYLQSLKGQAR